MFTSLHNLVTYELGITYAKTSFKLDAFCQLALAKFYSYFDKNYAKNMHK